MKVKMQVRTKFDNTEMIKKAVEKLTSEAVYIGVPAEKGARKDGFINNAELSYIHEFGAPGAGIPERPHLRPGVERILPEAAKELKEASSQAMQGNIQAVEKAFNRIGLEGQNSVRQMFQDNDWPPLAEGTLTYKPLLKDKRGNVIKDKKGKPMRKPSRLEEGKINPLMLTGSLRNAHTYVIRKKVNA